jgi:hypothetical protein
VDISGVSGRGLEFFDSMGFSFEPAFLLLDGDGCDEFPELALAVNGAGGSEPRS